jgi:dipeptidyl-peptidase-4
VTRHRILWLGLAALALTATGCGEASTPSTAPSTTSITARELVQPGALVGPGPENLKWSPKGAQLAYTLQGEDGAPALWLFDAASNARRVVLAPAGAADDIDVTSAQWSPTGAQMLLTGATSLWLLDVASGHLTKVAAGGEGAFDAMTFTPRGRYVTYTRGNDMYVTRLSDGAVRRVTTDGSQSIFNGCLDWVYKEELATRAAQPGYSLAPDGQWLMYMRLDDGEVHNDPVTDYTTIPSQVTYTRYPTVGTPNPRVSLRYLSSSGTGTIRAIPLASGTEYILPFYAWAPDSSEVFWISVNRDHTVLRLNAFNPVTGRSRIAIEETDPDWINEDQYAAPVFLPDGKRFLWLSERDGFMHLYLYSIKDGLIGQLTKGDWLVETTPQGTVTAGRPVYVDPAGAWAYFNSTAAGVRERQLYRVSIADGRLEQLTETAGFHMAALSADGKYLAEQFSAVDTPPVTTILTAAGAEAAELGTCAGPALTLPEVSREFVTIKAHDGVELQAQLVRPAGFDPQKKYPVVVHWYGGPGRQVVANRYGTTNAFNLIERDTLYTQAGFLVWRLDNRGSYGRGKAFERPLAGALGPAALDDQLAGVEYLKTLPYVDAARIGTDGKSFGGFMTLYALLTAPDVFRCGVAGSAPTDWSWYDSIYTERYMHTPDENPHGYEETNLVKRAAELKATPLIIHGLADTNVHLQNSINFVQVLEQAGRPFIFLPLVGLDHAYVGDGLVTALSASVAYFEEQFAR